MRQSDSCLDPIQEILVEAEKEGRRPRVRIGDADKTYFQALSAQGMTLSASEYLSGLYILCWHLSTRHVLRTSASASEN